MSRGESSLQQSASERSACTFYSPYFAFNLEMDTVNKSNWTQVENAETSYFDLFWGPMLTSRPNKRCEVGQFLWVASAHGLVHIDFTPTQSSKYDWVRLVFQYCCHYRKSWISKCCPILTSGTPFQEHFTQQPIKLTVHGNWPCFFSCQLMSPLHFTPSVWPELKRTDHYLLQAIPSYSIQNILYCLVCT